MRAILTNITGSRPVKQSIQSPSNQDLHSFTQEHCANGGQVVEGDWLRMGAIQSRNWCRSTHAAFHRVDESDC